MARATVLPLEITVTNPPVYVKLEPIEVSSFPNALSVSTSGETVTIVLPEVE